MPNRDNIALEQMENTLARMGMALQAAAVLQVRLDQIEHRLPQVPVRVRERLGVIVEGAKDNLAELCNYVCSEFENAVVRRDEYRQEQSNGNGCTSTDRNATD